MASGTITVSGTATGLEGGSKTYGPLQIASNPSNTNALGAITTVILGNGNNVITIPTGCNGLMVNFASGSVVTKTIKGIGGDTGFQVATTGLALVVSFVGISAPATFTISTSGADTGNVTEIWFE